MLGWGITKDLVVAFRFPLMVTLDPNVMPLLADKPVLKDCNAVNVFAVVVLATFPVRLTAPATDTAKSAAGNEATPVRDAVAIGDDPPPPPLDAIVIVFPACVMVTFEPLVIDTVPVRPLIDATVPLVRATIPLSFGRVIVLFALTDADGCNVVNHTLNTSGAV